MDKINSINLSDIGTTLLSGAYSALLSPAPLKPFVENDDRSQDGTQVLISDDPTRPSYPRLAERDVTLTFLVQGPDENTFWSYRNQFMEQLYKGKVVLYVSKLDMYFHLIYSNTTSYSHFPTCCKMAVKFNEPNPRNRKANDSSILL